jgi:hypothetical protein
VKRVKEREIERESDGRDKREKVRFRENHRERV